MPSCGRCWAFARTTSSRKFIPFCMVRLGQLPQRAYRQQAAWEVASQAHFRILLIWANAEHAVAMERLDSTCLSSLTRARSDAGLSPLSPVLKSLLADNEPAAVLHRGRESLMRRIESRFRFLAVRERLPTA